MLKKYEVEKGSGVQGAELKEPEVNESRLPTQTAPIFNPHTEVDCFDEPLSPNSDIIS